MTTTRTLAVLLLDDHWTWDFWLAQDGGDHHLFFLKAPTSLGDPDLRHHHARIGHAVSRNLRDWALLPDALGPGAPGDWDDLATWTGSVVRDGGRWWMFYTGVSSADDGRTQRIGRAWSADLVSWHKDPDFLLETTEDFEQPCTDTGPDHCWRDPQLFRDPDHGGWAMLVTARLATGSLDGRGVVGLLRSTDLDTWTSEGAVTGVGEFGHQEVPQSIAIEGRHYLVFCAYAECTSAGRQSRVGRVTGTHYCVGTSASGPFAPASDALFAADEAGSLYAGKVVRDPVTGGWALLAFLQFDADGRFIGGLSDPVPITVTEGGRLVLDRTPAEVVERVEARRCELVSSQ